MVRHVTTVTVVTKSSRIPPRAVRGIGAQSAARKDFSRATRKGGIIEKAVTVVTTVTVEHLLIGIAPKDHRSRDLHDTPCLALDLRGRVGPPLIGEADTGALERLP